MGEIMSEKRFECVFIEDDEFGGTFRRLKDNETNITYMVCDVVDLLNFQNTQIKILKEQVQILKKEVRDFLHLCDVCDIQSHLSDECEEVLNDE